MSEDQNEEPKIIVDDDWKSQVQKEKEQANNPEDQPEMPGEYELPEPSFLTLLSMLGAQAMSALGVMPDPMTGEASVNRPLAKHCIDTIGVMQEKTKGNLTDDEAAHIRDALHQLRMLYVSTGNAPNQGDADSETGGSSIELP